MSTSTTIASPERPAAATPSLLSRIVQVFVSPGELFAGFREHAPWGGALGLLLLVIAATAGASFFLVPDQMVVDFMKGQMLASGAPQLPPDEVLMTQAKIGKAMGAIIGPIAQAIIVFLSAGICSLAFSVLGGGQARFGQYLAIVSHGMYIPLLGALLALPLQLKTGELDLAYSLALAAPALGVEAGTITHHIMKQMDIFFLWALVVAGIGVAAVNGRRSWLTPAAVLFAVYMFFAVGIPVVIKAVTSAA
jgi:hypothetical protein